VDEIGSSQMVVERVVVLSKGATAALQTTSTYFSGIR